MEDDTTVRVKNDTWHRLKRLKEPGKSFDEIINELLDERQDSEEHATPDP